MPNPYALTNHKNLLIKNKLSGMILGKAFSKSKYYL